MRLWTSIIASSHVSKHAHIGEIEMNNLRIGVRCAIAASILATTIVGCSKGDEKFGEAPSGPGGPPPYAASPGASPVAREGVKRGPGAAPPYGGAARAASPVSR